ncbi:NHS-like protein 3 isoform X2 [Clinocottus analis]|uniref:NHS-like protein 3 isoform X2 n=1 Tax=Clinocottus analis TaxID=304258 RepID=UPI0035C1DB9B
MSNRDSMGFGDLIPQDVVDIFAEEKHSKRGRKKRSRSLGRALNWLKGKKRKSHDVMGQGLGLGPALDLALDGHPAGHKGGPKSGRQTHSQAVPKRDDDDKTPAPPARQENVFIEASRPKYLENLHSEALEGLKMMQQEETNNGVEFQDNQSTTSTITVHTDGFMSDSTIGDTTSVRSVQSSVSTRSSRSGLTRQESTFRPLNSGKKSEKTKTRRRHRKTVGEIPQHVKRELGLDRVGWSVTQKLDEEQLYNGETDESSTTDGPQHRGAGAGLNKDQLKQLNDHAGHGDDLLHCLGPDLSGGQSPLTLAFPWIATANSLQQEPPSPVMSMSPQAAYMSKIIPNAVLPPSIEVVEISRGRSRNSVRTVSKSSLLLSSPSPSRASSRASSSRTTSSRSSNVTSASRYNPINVSDSSCWSNSESSETLVSDSSTISRGSTPRHKRSQNGDASAKEDKISVHSISKASRCTANGKIIIKGEEVKNEGPFARSLSVMKPKKAPPPPNRSYSLHNKMKRRSRDLAEVRVNTKESSPYNLSASGEENGKNKSGYSPVPSSTIDSPGYTADTSSLDESPGSASFSPIRSLAHKAEGAVKVEETVSQEKQKLHQENTLSNIISPSSGYSSQDGASSQVSKQPHKRGILAKLQRFFPGSTHAASPPGDLKPDTSVDTVNISPSVRALRELFNIPPPPKVHAPPAPPPEVWAHSKRSFELLLGPPAPDNLYAIIKKNPKDRRQQRQSPSASTESSVKSLVIERKHKNPAVTVESVNRALNVLETKKVQGSGVVSAESHKENRLAEQNVDLKGNSKVTEKDEKGRVSDIINVMLVRAIEKREGKLEAVREEEEVKKTATQTSEVKTYMDTLPAISLARILPSPSPPLVHHPPQQTTLAPVSTVVSSPEASWPPPPPPLAGLNGPDVIDFPLPPPPMFGEVPLVLPVQVPPERSTNVVKTECVRANTEIEPQRSSSSQGIAPPPLSIPPPPPYMAPPPPVNTVSPPTSTTKEVTPPPPPPLPKVVIPPPPPKVVTPPPPPKEVTPPPPPKEVTPPPPPKEVTPVRPKESSPILVVQEAPPLVKDVSIAVVSPSPVIEISHLQVSPQPPTEVSTLSTEEVSFPSPQENACQSSEEVSKLTPPQSIPPPPPLLSKQEMDLPQESVPFKSETGPDSSDIILTPPQSIPPQPPVQPPQVVPRHTDGPATQEPLSLPPSEVSIPPALENSLLERAQEPAPSPPVNIPLPVQDLASITDPSSPPSTEYQVPELTSDPVVQEEPAPISTPPPNSIPETPEAQNQPGVEVTMRKQQPSYPVPTSSASGEAPQKPIRKSLILISSTSPPPSSPPAIVTTQPALPKSVLVLPVSSSTVICPTKKSPPATTASPSMNLQEAIRLRTAARSKTGSQSRLSMNSPTSPVNLHKSPSSTASFIFSKSNKKVVIETKPAPETVATEDKHLELSSGTKEVKVPPPVAKKPKAKGKVIETGEGTEQTAGQDALQESIMDAAEKANATAGTVEGGGTPSA